MRGLPALLSMVDKIYDTMEESPKISTASCPIFLLQERPVEHTRPAIRGYRRWKPLVQFETTKPAVTPPAKEFTAAFDVSLFKPEDITVKLVERDIVVEGKHEEREDEHGFIARQFTRRITIPKEFDTETVTTYLSNDGKMTIKAFKPKPADPQERFIPIKRIASGVLEEVATPKKKKDLETEEKETEKENVEE